MPTSITPEQIAEYRRQRVQECGEKLAALMAEYNCDLVAMPQIVDGRIVAVVQIVSKD